MSSAIELKLLQAVTTGLALSHNALMLGSSTMYLAISFGLRISFPIRLSSSKVWGQLKSATEVIPYPSRSKTRPPASSYFWNDSYALCCFFSSSGISNLSEYSVNFSNLSTSAGLFKSVSAASQNLKDHAWSIRYTSWSFWSVFVAIRLMRSSS